MAETTTADPRVREIVARIRNALVPVLGHLEEAERIEEQRAIARDGLDRALADLERLVTGSEDPPPPTGDGRDAWARDRAAAHRIAHAMRHDVERSRTGTAAYDADELAEHGITPDPTRAGRLEAEVQQALEGYGLVMDWTIDGLEVRWDGLYVVAAGDDAQHEITRNANPSDVAPDCATWRDVAETFALERAQRVSVWKSVDYMATVPRQGPVADAPALGGDDA